MDPRWLPWCWAAGAVGCAVLFFAALPCRGEYRRGLTLLMKYPAAWLLPAALLVLDALMDWMGKGQGGVGVNAVAARDLSGDLADALRQGLHGWTLGAGAGVVGAVLVIFNVAGIRQGFVKGVGSALAGTVEKGRGGAKTSPPVADAASGAGRLAVGVMVLGLVALVADAALRGRGVPPVWHGAVRVLAIPLTGWVSAAVLAGLLLLMETVCRAPEKVSEVRWLESAAAHGVRLWPWAAVHGIGAWARVWVPAELGLYVSILTAATGLGMVFAPLVFLHVKRREQAGAGARAAVDFWREKAWQPLAWAAALGILTALWWQAGQGLAAAGRDAPGWVGIGLAGLVALGQIVLTVLSLGAWVALRVADSPPPARAKRSRKSSTP